MACGSCVETIQREKPKDSHAAFTRALLFGIGGAILGLIVYSAFAILTGVIIGYASLAVGYIVAKAMMMGSLGIGGRRYQIVAVILTYAAVSISAIPIAMSYTPKNTKPQHQAQTLNEPTDSPSVDQSNSDWPSSEPAQTRSQMGLGEKLIRLALLGLASPFVELFEDPFGGGIGLVILIVGVRIAWKMAQGKVETVVYGPFENSAAAP